MSVYSCSHNLHGVCETYTSSMHCDTKNLVGKVRGLGLAHDPGLVPDHGLVLELNGYLFKIYTSWREATPCRRLGFA